jgi:Tfp pilus assembly protein PilO
VSRNYRILLVAVVAVLAVGGYWKLALAPKRAEAAALAQQVAAADAQLAQNRSLLATYQGARDEYKVNYAKVVNLGKAVPSDDDTRSLLVQLDAAAKRSNASFSTLDVASAGSSSPTGTTAQPVAPGAVSAGSYSEMPFTLSFSGNFDSLSNFLGRLQRFVSLQGDRILVNGRLMRVESIQVQPGQDGWPALSAQVTASTYIVPDAQASATSTPSPSGTTTTTTTTTSSGAAADHRPE